MYIDQVRHFRSILSGSLIPIELMNALLSDNYKA